MATTHTRNLSLYDRQELIGTIKVAEDGTAVAFDPSGKRVGRYPSVKEATAAFAAPVQHARARNE